jgi:hypothetical protein
MSKPMDAGAEARGVTIINVNASLASCAQHKVTLLNLCRKHGVDLRTIEWFCLPENAIFWETLARKLEEIDRRSTMGDGHFKVKNPSAWLTKFFNTIKKQNASLIAQASAPGGPQSSASAASAVSSATSGVVSGLGSATSMTGGFAKPPADRVAAAGNPLVHPTVGKLTERELALLGASQQQHEAAVAAAQLAQKAYNHQHTLSFSDAGPGMPMPSGSPVGPTTTTKSREGSAGMAGAGGPPGLGAATGGSGLPTMSPEEARRLLETM